MRGSFKSKAVTNILGQPQCTGIYIPVFPLSSKCHVILHTLICYKESGTRGSNLILWYFMEVTREKRNKAHSS